MVDGLLAWQDLSCQRKSEESVFFSGTCFCYDRWLRPLRKSWNVSWLALQSTVSSINKFSYGGSSLNNVLSNSLTQKKKKKITDFFFFMYWRVWLKENTSSILKWRNILLSKTIVAVLTFLTSHCEPSSWTELKSVFLIFSPLSTKLFEIYCTRFFNISSINNLFQYNSLHICF